MDKVRAKRGPTAPQRLEAASHPTALLKIDVVRQLTGLGTTSIYKMMGHLAIRIGARCTRWRASDVQKFLESLK